MNYELFGLSNRVRNICFKMGLLEREQIAAAIKDGRLNPKTTNSMLLYGWKAHIELHKWLGLPRPRRAKPRLKMCPHCGGKL